MGRLAKAGIQAFVLYGNHDAESQITKHLIPPANVKVFSSRQPDTFLLKELGVALHGQSFRQCAVTDNLVPGYPDPVSGMFNIGVLHTALGGMGDHDNYAPCCLEELVAKGYDYWALGHVHHAALLHEHPHIVFPGNLQGRHIRETGPKGAHIVTVEDRQIADFTSIHSDIVRWTHLAVAIDECRRATNVVDCVRQAIEKAVAGEADGRLLACRIELTGCSNIHGDLIASTEHLLAEAQAAALGLGGDVAWIEKVVVATTPLLDPAKIADRQDALGELQRMLGDAGKDEDLLRQLKDDIGELGCKLPVDLRTEVEDAALKAAVEGDYANLIVYATEYLNARLTAAGE
jgi:hypothetical protein